MNDNANVADSPLLSGPLDDPLQSWPNSDLLIDAEDRAFFARHYPAFAPIFDWPELRALFEVYNSVAAKARQHSRRAGVIAVLCGFLGLSIAATVPLSDEATEANHLLQLRAQAIIGGIAAAFAILSVVIGYTQILRGKGKSQWLTNRFWCERIRQFHFQLIINHLPEVVAAAQNKEALADWLTLRARELDKFRQEYLRGAEDMIHHLDADEAEDCPWVADEWDRIGAVPPASAEFDLLLKLLEKQRFGIQQRYAERRLEKGWYSPETRTQWVSELSDALTAVLLIATMLVGIGSIMAVTRGASPTFRLVAGLVAGISSSSVVAMRALKEGLLFTTDAERYRWYLAAVRTLNHRFEHADLEQKVLLLREIERLAYQEMRRFLLAGRQARFVM